MIKEIFETFTLREIIWYTVSRALVLALIFILPLYI